MHILKSNLLSI